MSIVVVSMRNESVVVSMRHERVVKHRSKYVVQECSKRVLVTIVNVSKRNELVVKERSELY